MSAGSAFLLFNQAALVAWLVLAGGVLLRNVWLVGTLAGRFVPFLLGVAYAALIAISWGSAEGGFSSLAGVRSLFQSDWLLLAGWLHYLAFDLFVGSWIARTVLESGMNRLLLVPILPLTFMFGPVGFVAFEIARALRTATSATRQAESIAPSTGGVK
jgi:hypothetical protein